MKYVLVIILSAYAFSVFAQSEPRSTISGFIRDSLNSESLIGATVHNKNNLAGASANQFGFYSLTLSAGEVELVYSYVGYNTQTLSFQLRSDTVINMNLAGGQHLQEVAITASRTSLAYERTQMSMINVPIAQIRSLPAVLGATDVMRALQLTPGIQMGSEGSTGLHVRGGSQDQNLILLDGVPIYNASHLLGFVSLFNGDALNNVDVYKGGFPARYGGRVSSVIDISMKEGNMQKFQGEGAIGIMWSSLTFEGPIVKDRTSFIVSGRRTYYDLLMAPFIGRFNRQPDREIVKAGYYFSDLTAKINHRFSDKNRIYLSAYTGDDKFYGISNFKYEHDEILSGKDRTDLGLQWGNFMTTFRWNHIFTNRLFSNTTLALSRYRDNYISKKSIDRTYNENSQSFTTYDFSELQNNFGIQDWIGKIAFDYILSPDHHVRFGAGVTYHTFNPGRVSLSDTNGSRHFGASKRYAWEYSVYIEDDIRLTERLRSNVGLHWSAYSMGNVFYNVLQPRISARYLIIQQLSAKVSFTRMAQYVHLLANSFNGFPRDLWVPTTESLRPQTANQIALGFAHNHKKDYELNLEGYYKTINNVTEFREGSGFLNVDQAWEKKLLQGTGRSYGIEFFAHKKTGVFTGLMGYTLSWTDRHFDELNDGKRFPYKYDRRHDLNIAMMQRFKREKRDIEFSASWVLSSGHMISLPVGIADVNHPMIRETNGQYTRQYLIYGERNGFRLEPYHRLDLIISFIRQRKWGERRWVWSAYNLYSRINPYYITVEIHRSGGAFQVIQHSLFPIIPSVSYQFKF